MPGSPSPSPTPTVDHPHDEVGRYEVQCSVGQKRDESAGPCPPDCDRRPAGAIDEAGMDGLDTAMIRPSSGSIRPAISPSKVDLPAPDRPRRLVVSAVASKTSSWSRTRTVLGPEPYLFKLPHGARRAEQPGTLSPTLTSLIKTSSSAEFWHRPSGSDGRPASPGPALRRVDRPAHAR